MKTKVAEIAKTDSKGRISGSFTFGWIVNFALTIGESANPPFFVTAVRCTTPMCVSVCVSQSKLRRGRKWGRESDATEHSTT